MRNEVVFVLAAIGLMCAAHAAMAQQDLEPAVQTSPAAAPSAPSAPPLAGAKSGDARAGAGRRGPRLPKHPSNSACECDCPCV